MLGVQHILQGIQVPQAQPLTAFPGHWEAGTWRVCPASASAVVTFHTEGPSQLEPRLCSHDKVATLGTESQLNPNKNTSPCGSVWQDPSASL